MRQKFPLASTPVVIPEVHYLVLIHLLALPSWSLPSLPKPPTPALKCRFPDKSQYSTDTLQDIKQGGMFISFVLDVLEVVDLRNNIFDYWCTLLTDF